MPRHVFVIAHSDQANVRRVAALASKRRPTPILWQPRTGERNSVRTCGNAAVTFLFSRRGPSTKLSASLKRPSPGLQRG
jgi:hypothetical protein